MRLQCWADVGHVGVDPRGWISLGTNGANAPSIPQFYMEYPHLRYRIIWVIDESPLKLWLGLHGFTRIYLILRHPNLLELGLTTKQNEASIIRNMTVCQLPRERWSPSQSFAVVKSPKRSLLSKNPLKSPSPHLIQGALMANISQEIVPELREGHQQTYQT